MAKRLPSLLSFKSSVNEFSFYFCWERESALLLVTVTSLFLFLLLTWLFLILFLFWAHQNVAISFFVISEFIFGIFTLFFFSNSNLFERISCVTPQNKGEWNIRKKKIFAFIFLILVCIPRTNTHFRLYKCSKASAAYIQIFICCMKEKKH